MSVDFSQVLIQKIGLTGRKKVQQAFENSCKTILNAFSLRLWLIFTRSARCFGENSSIEMTILRTSYTRDNLTVLNKKDYSRISTKTIKVCKKWDFVHSKMLITNYSHTNHTPIFIYNWNWHEIIFKGWYPIKHHTTNVTLKPFNGGQNMLSGSFKENVTYKTCKCWYAIKRNHSACRSN